MNTERDCQYAADQMLSAYLDKDDQDAAWQEDIERETERLMLLPMGEALLELGLDTATPLVSGIEGAIVARLENLATNGGWA